MESTQTETCVHDLNARSVLVSRLFDRLNAMRAEYCVMNNYLDLPRTIPSDVDIAIHPDVFRRLDSVVQRLAGDQSARIIQKLWHGNHKCAYILSNADASEPFFVQLDFFTDFSTSSCPNLIPFHELVRGRRSFRNFFIPDPMCEVPFIAMRRIFKDDWSPRHCQRIAELLQSATPSAALSERYKWLHDVLQLAKQSNVKELSSRRAADWARMKRFAWVGLRPGQFVGVAYWQSRRILYRLRHETGNALVVPRRAETSPGEHERIAHALREVFYRTLRISGGDHPAAGILAVPRAIALAARIKFAKLRKTLVLLTVDPADASALRFTRLLSRIGVVDGTLQRESNSHSLHETVAFILKIQAGKTELAMRHSSQTGPDDGV